MKIFFLLKFINYSQCIMVSIQSKVKNNATLYAFFINEKNELLTIFTKEKI